MILFIRNIPRDTRSSDLSDFVAPALTRLLFRSGSIIKVEILVLRDKRTQELQYHGLVHLDSEKTGKMVIKKLRGKPFKNKSVIVREYIHRSWHNDRRNHENVFTGIERRRSGDRRGGSNLEVVKKAVPIRFS